jgi:hypothetical protein
MLTTDHPRYHPECALCRFVQGPCIFHYQLDPPKKKSEAKLADRKLASEKPN